MQYNNRQQGEVNNLILQVRQFNELIVFPTTGKSFLTTEQQVAENTERIACMELHEAQREKMLRITNAVHNARLNIRDAINDKAGTEQVPFPVPSCRILFNPSNSEVKVASRTLGEWIDETLKGWGFTGREDDRWKALDRLYRTHPPCMMKIVSISQQI